MRLFVSAAGLAAFSLALSACGGPLEPADAPDAVEAAVAEEAAAEPATAAAGAPRLEQLWVATGFEAPEGVALGPDGNYFISNVADIGQVVTFDAHNGARLDTITIEGAQFLNDMTVWNGEVLVADSGTASIHRLTPEGPQLLGASADWAGINGLLGDGDRLLITTMTEGYLIDLRSADQEDILAGGMIDADGVGILPGGGYLVSSWPGQIHYVSEDGQVTTLQDTREEGVLQNDLSVFGDVVIVPNWMPGTVTAWRVAQD